MIRITKYRAELASAADSAEIHHQLWVAGQYRRALAWMTNGQRRAERALFLADPQIAAAEAALADPACPDRNAVITRLRELRIARAKTPEHQAARTEIWSRRSWMECAIRAAVVARGLYWGTYQLVADAHARAVRDSHLWEDIVVRGSWDQIGVVITAKQPILGADFVGGTDTRVRVAAQPLVLDRSHGDLYGRLVESAVNRSGAARPRAWRLCQIRVGSGETTRIPRWVSAYIRTEAKSGAAERQREEIRRVPPTARIVGVRLVRTDTVHRPVRDRDQGKFRMAARERWELHVVHHDVEARTTPTPDAGVVGVDIGWRRVDGGIRIGSAVGACGYSQLVIPDRVLNDGDRADGIRAVRDRYTDQARALIMSLRDAHPWLVAHTEAIHAWRRIGRFVPVVNLICARVNTHPTDGLGWVALALAAWLGKDQHLREYEAGLRRSQRLSVQGRQREWVAAILRRATVVGIEDDVLNVARMRQRGVTPEDTRQAAVAHTAASPGALRTLIAQMAVSRGIRVVEVRPKPTCSSCSAAITPGASPTVVCDTCGAQDDPNRVSAVAACTAASAAVMAADNASLASEVTPAPKPRRRLSNRRRAQTTEPLASAAVTADSV